MTARSLPAVVFPRKSPVVMEMQAFLPHPPPPLLPLQDPVLLNPCLGGICTDVELPLGPHAHPLQTAPWPCLGAPVRAFSHVRWAGPGERGAASLYAQGT